MNRKERDFSPAVLVQIAAPTEQFSGTATPDDVPLDGPAVCLATLTFLMASRGRAAVPKGGLFSLPLSSPPCPSLALLSSDSVDLVAASYFVLHACVPVHVSNAAGCHSFGMLTRRRFQRGSWRSSRVGGGFPWGGMEVLLFVVFSKLGFVIGSRFRGRGCGGEMGWDGKGDWNVLCGLGLTV
jgi:hypothetical protein